MPRSRIEAWWPYTFEFIPRSRLKIERFDGDGGFQRPQSARFVEQQVRQFDPRRFEPLIVVALIDEDNPDDFFYSVIDGQHRDMMAEERGIDMIPCIVHRELLTYEQRAILFNELNLRRRQLNLRDSMVARHQGKDEDMLGLLALLDRLGFYLDGHKPDEANGVRALYARGALDHNYKLDGSALAKALLTMQAWDDMAGRRVQGVIIDALCLLARDEDFDPQRMRDIFAEFGPQALIREAREIAAAAQGPVTKKVVGTALLHHYNKGLRSRRISLDD